MSKMNESKEIYKSIEAPSELRERVLHAANAVPERKSRGYVIRALALAACLVLIVGAFALINLQKDPSVQIGGVTVGETAVKLDLSIEKSRAREVQNARLSLTLNTDKETLATVSAGRLISESDEEITVFSESIKAFWEIAPSELGEAQTLALKCGKNTQTYSLKSNENGEYYLSIVK